MNAVSVENLRPQGDGNAVVVYVYCGERHDHMHPMLFRWDAERWPPTCWESEDEGDENSPRGGKLPPTLELQDKP